MPEDKMIDQDFTDSQLEKLKRLAVEPRRGKTGYILLPAEDYEDWDKYINDYKTKGQ